MWTKVKSHLLVPAVALLATILCWSNNANSAVVCSAATVMKVGPVASGSGNVVVSLRNDSGGAVGTWLPGAQRQYFMSDLIKNQGLAVILTAMALDKKIWLQIVDDSATNNSLIQIVYLNR